MSTVIDPQEAAAANQVVGQAWIQAYFSKLAEFGHVVHSDQEAQALLRMADLVDAQPTKEASAVGPYTQLCSALENHLGVGAQQPLAQARQKAANFLQNTQVYNAVLTQELARLN